MTRPSRNKKLNIDARHLAVFDVISSLLDLSGGAEVQKKILADVRLLSELNSFLDRPASSRLIFTWGHLSETDVTGRSSEQSSSNINKQKKALGNPSNSNVSKLADIDVLDSWMIYKEEVPGFLSSFLFFLRIFCIFGVAQPNDPLQFITLSAVEKGAKILEIALGYSLDLSQLLNSRSFDFGSSQKVHYITMDTFCNWAVSLGLADELDSVWLQELLRSSSPPTSPSRKFVQSGDRADAAKSIAQNSTDGNTLVPERLSDDPYRNAEERLLHFASNQVQSLSAWNELLEFSGASTGPIEFSNVDRWIVNLFPMLDFSPALHRAFRRLQQHRRQHKDHKQKEQPGSKSPKIPNNSSSLMSQEFGTLLTLAVYYRRMYET
jgi:hypothetical protein